jgi:Lrp/AsnC family leucine-responsive transcriptional regulator
MPKQDLDRYDRGILRELQRDGRLSTSELADRIGLSTSPCWRRVRRLEEKGIIRHYMAMLAPEAVGLGLDVFVYVSLDLHRAKEFEAVIQQRSEVVECHAIAGDQDYLLHVMVPDIESFDHFLRAELIDAPGVDRVRTSFALKTIKHRTPLPLDFA